MKAAISFFVIVLSGLAVQGQSTTAPRTGRGDTVQREQQQQGVSSNEADPPATARWY